MLLLVLVLVIVAFGLLVTAITTSAMVWAWVSVGVSAVAAVLLVVDWSRRRRLAAARENAVEADRERPVEVVPTRGAVSEQDAVPEQNGVSDEDVVPESTTGSEPVAEPVAAPTVASKPADLDLDLVAEPAEEDTDAADLLTVSELTAEVRVVDERPRYHLATCRWLADKPTLAIPVGEARQLAFTPCAVCSPDRTLAAAERRTRAAR